MSSIPKSCNAFSPHLVLYPALLQPPYHRTCSKALTMEVDPRHHLNTTVVLRPRDNIPLPHVHLPDSMASQLTEVSRQSNRGLQPTIRRQHSLGRIYRKSRKLFLCKSCNSHKTKSTLCRPTRRPAFFNSRPSLARPKVRMAMHSEGVVVV